MAFSLTLGHLNAFPSCSSLPPALPRSAHIPSSCPLPVPKPVLPKSHVNPACFHLDLGYPCMRLLSAVSQLSSASLPLLGCAQALEANALLLQRQVLLHGWVSSRGETMNLTSPVLCKWRRKTLEPCSLNINN